MRKTPLQVHLDPAMMAALREEAKRREVSIGEVVRLAVKQLILATPGFSELHSPSSPAASWSD